MSKERARRRAEERARRSTPRPKHEPAPPPQTKKSAPKRTARQQRQRNRLIVIGVLWLLANAVIWVFTDTWNARWLGLTVTTIAIPLIVWLVWDPQRRTGL